MYCYCATDKGSKNSPGFAWCDGRRHGQETGPEWSGQWVSDSRGNTVASTWLHMKNIIKWYCIAWSFNNNVTCNWNVFWACHNSSSSFALRFALFHNVRIPRENLLNRTGDVAANGHYISPFKVSKTQTKQHGLFTQLIIKQLNQIVFVYIFQWFQGWGSCMTV